MDDTTPSILKAKKWFPMFPGLALRFLLFSDGTEPRNTFVDGTADALLRSLMLEICGVPTTILVFFLGACLWCKKHHDWLLCDRHACTAHLPKWPSVDRHVHKRRYAAYLGHYKLGGGTEIGREVIMMRQLLTRTPRTMFRGMRSYPDSSKGDRSRALWIDRGSTAINCLPKVCP